MNTMNSLVWLLPIIFMLHDFEEIIMAEIWSKRYKKKIDMTWPKMKPFALNYVHICQTPTFSIGVEIEFLIFSLISLLSVIFDSYFIWYGAFLGLALHMLFLHIGLCISFKKYVPGIITSIIFLPVSIFLLIKAEGLLSYGIGTILLGFLLGIALIIIMIPALHRFMGPCSNLLDNYSKA